jgi:hypothetical protein
VTQIFHNGQPSHGGDHKILLMILLDAKMVSMDLIAPSFSSLAKSREVKERHGSWIKLAGYIGKIDIHMLSRACGSYQDFQSLAVDIKSCV